MTVDEFESYRSWSVQQYADDQARAGRWGASEALARAQAEFGQLLPNGPETPDHFLRIVLDESTGEAVGEVWYNLQPSVGPGQLFLYWIGIHPEHRRQGLGSEVLRLLEAEAVRLGVHRVALHVFGENTVAQALYRKMGFRPTNVLMAKDLPA
jgi:ribosomal protein S18 acetylase RimI-like enzyme